MDQNNKRHWFRNPQTAAWLVVGASFILFCVICAAGTLGAYWFFFESPTNLTAQLTVSQGTVSLSYLDTNELVSDPAANPKTLPQIPSTIRVSDNNSQGYITFEDTSRQVLATVFFLGSSSARITEASRPSFPWSKREYRILLTNAQGHFVVDVPSDLSRPLILNIDSSAGTVRLDQGGSYVIDALDQSLKLYAQSGTGLLVTPSYQARQIEAGMEGMFSRGSQQVVVRNYPYRNLIVDEINRADPSTVNANSLGDGEQKDRLPAPWACGELILDQNEPEGSWELKRGDQQPTLHMYRLGKEGNLISHAETGCELWFEKQPAGLDIRQYKSLRIHLRMRIQSQDITVPTCGIRGSECPVMLLIDYKPADDPNIEVARVWRQGFYSIRPPDDTNPETCDTCKHVHEQIDRNTWYIYDSNDLLKEFPEEQKPVSIVRIRVYSSGHQYDVELSELALLGEQ